MPCGMKSQYRIASNLLIKNKDALKADPLPDDLALIVKTDRGLVVILGCGHRGIINTIRHAQTLTGEDRVYGVVGGTHLAPASDERLVKTIEALKIIDVKKFGVSHCTGFKASTRLATRLGIDFF